MEWTEAKEWEVRAAASPGDPSATHRVHSGNPTFQRREKRSGNILKILFDTQGQMSPNDIECFTSARCWAVYLMAVAQESLAMTVPTQPLEAQGEIAAGRLHKPFPSQPASQVWGSGSVLCNCLSCLPGLLSDCHQAWVC